MKFTSKLGERGQAVIPKAIRSKLGLNKNSAIEFEIKGAVVTLRARPKEFDMSNFDLAIKRYSGSLRNSFRAKGYKSVDEFIDASRGREPGTHDR